MADTDDDDFVFGSLVKNNVRVGSHWDPPQIFQARQSAASRLIQQEIEDGLDPALNASRPLRRCLRDFR